MTLPQARWWHPLVPAAALRLYDLGGQSYWTDEAITVQAALWPWSKLIAFWRVDPHPPLHYLLIRVLERLGGAGEGWLRLSSALAGIAAVALVCWMLYRQHGDRVAFVGGLLMALCPLHVWTSQELRAPALAGLFVAVAIYGLIRMEQTAGERGQWISGVGLLLAFYTHYYALLLVPLFLFASRPVRRVTAVALLGFAPWLVFLSSQLGAALGFRASTHLRRNVVETLLYANAGHFPWQWPTWANLLSGMLHHHFYAYVVLALVLVSPIFVLALFSGRDGWRFVRWYVAPTLLALLAGLCLPLFSPKYLAPFLPFLGAAAGIGYWRLRAQRRLWANSLLTAALLVPLISLVDHYANPVFRQTPWRDRLPALTANLTPRDRVVFYSATEAADARFYLDRRLVAFDLWPDYASAQDAVADELKTRLKELVDRRITHVVLVDLNGAAYRRTRELAVEQLNRTRPLIDDIELQPAMGVHWLVWGPPR